MRHQISALGLEQIVRAGDLTVDLNKRQIIKNGTEVKLTRKEYDVLSQLATVPGRVVTHQRILATAWPTDHDGHIEYLRIVVRNLRQKIETDPANPAIIINELGVGYRFMADT